MVRLITKGGESGKTYASIHGVGRENAAFGMIKSQGEEEIDMYSKNEQTATEPLIVKA